MSEEYRYKRVLLKLSGEALAGDVGYGIDPKTSSGKAIPPQIINLDTIWKTPRF